MNNYEIGRRITEARLKNGLNKKELANKIGIAESSIGRYESGKINQIKLPIISSIARATNVNPDWIIGKSNIIEVNQSNNENEFNDSKGSLDSQNIRLLSYLASFLNDDGLSELVKRAEELKALGYTKDDK